MKGTYSDNCNYKHSHKKSAKSFAKTLDRTETRLIIVRSFVRSPKLYPKHNNTIFSKQPWFDKGKAPLVSPCYKGSCARLKNIRS